MAALEAVEGDYEALTASLAAEIGSLRVSLTHAEAEARVLGETVAALRTELSTRTTVRPVAKKRGLPLPDLTIGYSGIIVSRDNRLAVMHGPGVALGYTIPLPRLF